MSHNATLAPQVFETDQDETTSGLDPALDEVAKNINFERCDAPDDPKVRALTGGSCGQRAYVITSHGGLPLSWCAHHYEAHKPSLFGGVLVRDARSRLGIKRESSAGL